MSKSIIWRNDDVSYKTEVGQFVEVHKLFKKYIVLHTIALICEDIEKNPELIEYINNNNISVQVHCWQHYDLSLNHDRIRFALPKCVETIERLFRHRPTVLYPPWNKTDNTVRQIAGDNGLTVSNEKVSLHQYIRTDGDIKEDVINFHSWSLPEIIVLEDALKIYVSKR